MPSSAARPPRISSTATIGSPDGSGVSSSAFAWVIRAMVPSGRMKMMSSGMSVLRIQKETSCGGS
jgi:hypothetical protein